MTKTFFAKLSFILSMLLLGFAFFGLLAPENAAAHGRRDLANGKYQIVFGFLNEPAFANQMNGIDLTVCEGACKTQDGKVQNPVKDADKTLKAEAIFGSQKIDVTLKSRYGLDGKYAGYFMPVNAGEYTFRIYGTLNGEKVDETVTSGKDGFNSVENPLALGSAATAVSGASEQSVKETRDQASQATIFGIIGIVLGLIGVGVGAFGLTRSAKPAQIQTERELVGSGRKEIGG